MGLQAIETEYVLLGDEATQQEYREQFERVALPMETHTDTHFISGHILMG